MRKILLVGNPNVGKSAIFSRLTGARVTVANYPGTTVEFTQGYLQLKEEKFLVVDLPGTYTLEPLSKAEEVACSLLQEKNCLIINVVDATNLERNLNLTLQLLEKGLPIIVALNMWDDAQHRGIEIDVKKLEALLGVKVVPTCGLTGEGIKELLENLGDLKPPQPFHLETSKERWEKIGEIIKEVQVLHHRHHTFLEILSDLSVHPVWGLGAGLGIVYLAFKLIRFIGEGLIEKLFEPLFNNLWLPLMTDLSQFLGRKGFIHDILIGELIEGKIDLGVSFGLLTTGLFIPIAQVLPYIVSFYLILGLLEDWGYLPRLAVLVDNIMHRLGLHGYAILPMVLGLGCNVPGALATRLLVGRREKFIAVTLMAIAVPCMAQIAMITGLVGERGGQYLGIVFFTLIFLWFSLGRILNFFLKGESPELTLEIPPYRIPHPLAIVKKLAIRAQGFLGSALPYVLLGILLVNILYQLKIIEVLAFLLSPLFKNLWGLPSETISALLVGFLRKDVAVGMLAPLNLTTKELIISSTILAIYFPCAATFMVIFKELGLKDTFKSILIMLITTVVVGTALNLILPPIP
ncbi:MAG TPA: ferrous iron transporter B [Candidatus Omnitrophica bacterium]|nr:MAG: ferrous iron transporter B [Candidatus Omnitrophota bacterium]HEC69237.1 ferrous iron transporter B [Candidatus Omnitrophota bacterium]